MSLAIDGTPDFEGSFGGTSFSFNPYTTAVADDWLIVAAFLPTNVTNYITSITDTASLVWKRYTRLASNANTGSLEIWYAYKAGTGSTTVTVNSNSANCGGILFAVSGADTTHPFDINPSLPNFGTYPENNQGVIKSNPFNTTAANTMILNVCAGYNSDPGSTATNEGSGSYSWTTIEHGTKGIYSGMAAYYTTASSAATGVQVENTGGASFMISFAMVESGEGSAPSSFYVDSAASASGHGAGAPEISIATTATDTLLVLGINANNNVTVSSLTSSNSLTWTKQKAYTYATGPYDAEIWTAPFSSAGIETVTINFSSSSSGFSANALAIAGYNTGTPLDGNASLPGTANGTSGDPTSASIDTTNTVDCLIAFGGQQGNASIFTGASSGWTLGDSSGGYDSNTDTSSALAYQFVTSAQSGVTNAFTPSVSGKWGVVTIAVEGPPPPPSGTWASTEATDIFAGTGDIPPYGTWSSLETADKFVTPPFGTWGSTEAKDTFAATGDIPPPLQFDASATGGASDPTASGISTANVTLSTNFTNEVIVLEVVVGGFWHQSTVDTVTDTAGLTWKRRHKRFVAGSDQCDVEVWWAHAPTKLTGDVITVNLVGLAGAISMVACGIAGANYTTPWDTNTMAPWFYDSIIANPAAVNFSVSANESIMLAMYGSANVQEDGGVTAPFTYVGTQTESEHNGIGSYASLAYYQAATTQQGVGVSFTQFGGNTNTRGMFTDAIVSADNEGTTTEILWYLDALSIAGTAYNNEVLSATNAEISVSSITAFNKDLMWVVPVLIKSASGLGTVASMNDSQNLVESPGFTRRSRVTSPDGTVALEVWWGYASANFNGNTINVNTLNTASNDFVSAMAIGVGGVTASVFAGEPFWDGDPSLPALNAHDASPGTYPNVGGMTAINPHVLSIIFQANMEADEGGFAALPYVTSNLPKLDALSAGPTADLSVSFMYSDVLLDNQSAEFIESPAPEEWLVIGDAIVVNYPTPPSGLWGSTETKDTFTHSGDFSSIGIDGNGGWVGYVPAHATMATTDAKDTPHGAPSQAPYDSIGWLGWVPAFATMAPTDIRDVMTNTGGWVLGPTGITGRMYPTDARDRMSAGNIAVVTGTMGVSELKDRLASNALLIPKVNPPPLRKRHVLIVS